MRLCIDHLQKCPTARIKNNYGIDKKINEERTLKNRRELLEMQAR